MLFLVTLSALQLQPSSLYATGAACSMAIATLLAPSSSAGWPPKSAEWRAFLRAAVQRAFGRCSNVELQQEQQLQLEPSLQKKSKQQGRPPSKCFLHAGFNILGCLFLSAALMGELFLK